MNRIGCLLLAAALLAGGLGSIADVEGAVDDVDDVLLENLPPAPSPRHGRAAVLDVDSPGAFCRVRPPARSPPLL